MSEDLLAVLARLGEAGHGYELIVLRHTRIGPELVNQGDLDLLGSRAAIRAFLARLGQLAAGTALHITLARDNASKIRLGLHTLDLGAAVHLDLWTEVWQVEGGRHCVRFADLRGRCRSGPGAWLHMPEDLELALYVQHLRAKAKDLAAPAVQERLRHYATAARRLGRVELADAAGRIADQRHCDDRALALAERELRGQLGARYLGAAPRRRLARRARHLLTRRLARRRVAGVVALVGADGVGKTTLAETLAGSRESGPVEHLIGKSLYRRSLVFRVLYRLNRACGPLTLEQVDERAAPLAHLVAARALRRRARPGPPRTTILDRHLPDFLYLGRKTDRPRFSRFTWLDRWFHVPLPVVHLTTTHDSLRGRRTEVSPAGLAAYDRDMLAHYAALPVLDYLRFHNALPLEAAAGLLARHLRARVGLS